MLGTIVMAKKKVPNTAVPQAEQPGRVTIINLKGTAEQANWLESLHRKTHISKTVIVRLALSQWARSNGHGEFPPLEGDQ